MGRWEPDAQGRLRRAALELYAERGFEQTTVADIAERAGVTERTYFRYFADKREVLFDPSRALETTVLSAIDAAPAATPPLEAVAAAMVATGAHLADRDYSRERASVIAANPSLQERELLKLSALSAGAAAALVRRGSSPVVASLAADAGVSIFRIGFERWVGTTGDETLGDCIADAFTELRTLSAGAPGDQPPAAGGVSVDSASSSTSSARSSIVPLR